MLDKYSLSCIIRAERENMKTRIEQIVGELYRDGKVTFGEAAAILYSVEITKLSDKDIREIGTITKEGLQSLKGVV
jgi:hypothetical protein